MRPNDRSFAADFKRFFGRGLAVLLPSVLTLWILWQAFAFVFASVGEPINRGIRSVVIWVTPTVTTERQRPSWYRITEEQVEQARLSRDAAGERGGTDWALRDEIRRAQFKRFWDQHWYLSATGLVVAITLIYLAGLLLGGLIGRKVYARLEALISRIPGFKQVYPHVKQLVEMVIGEKPLAFKRVVLVEYPRKGIWSIGLVTSGSMRTIGEVAGGSCLTVFMPSTPTPFTGFAISVPETEVIDLPISIDEAIRFVLTGGVLIPDRQIVNPADLTTDDLGRPAALAARAPGGGANRGGGSGPPLDGA